MSLLDEAMETCTFLNKQVTPDGYGGYKTTWTDGAEFKAAIAFDTSVEMRIADVTQEISRYTVLTPRDLGLDYHDVFRRNSDRKTFRVTTDGTDYHTPQSAGLDLSYVEAEEWEVTS